MKFVKREKIEKNKKNKKNRSKCFGKGNSADIFPKQNGGFVHIFFFFFYMYFIFCRRDFNNLYYYIARFRSQFIT